MEYRRLWPSGPLVSRVGLGGLFVSRLGGNGRDGASLVVHRALERGVTYIDTAPAYADSEGLVGIALSSTDKPVVLSTKLGGRPEPFEPRNAAHLRSSLEQSLRLLGRDRIDLLLVHEPDRPGQYDWWGGTPASGPVMEFLDAVKAEGTVGAIGIAGTTAYELGALVRTGCFDVVLTAFNFSLLWREAADTVIREAVERGVTVIAGSPLQGGALAVRQDLDSPHNSWLSPPRREQFRQLYALSDEAGLSLPELAFRFVLSNPAIDVVLTGSRSVAEVDDAVDFEAAGPLDGDVLRALDALAAQLPCRPFEEPALLPFARAYDGPGVLR